MKTREIERALGAANPVGPGRLDGLDLEAMEADLLTDLEGDFSALLESEATRPRPRRPRRFALALGSAALAGALAVTSRFSTVIPETTTALPLSKT